MSRGRLVADFLIGKSDPKAYLDEIAAERAKYSGFNLVVGSNDGLYYYSNAVDASPRELDPGIYGLSNHLLNTPWPKVSNGLAAFERLIAKDEFSKSEAFDLLSDETLAADDALPDTGIGIEKERVLSPIFIRTPIYGTRSSAVVVSNADGDLELEERLFA